MEDRCDTIATKCSRSIHGDYILPEFSKPYLMYSTTNAASTALDFSKKNVEDRVVDSLPNYSAWRMLISLPSPLCDYRLIPI